MERGRMNTARTERRLYAECNPGGNAAPSQPPYNVEHIVHFGVIIIRDKLLSQCGGGQCSAGGCLSPVYAVPKDFCGWERLFAASGIQLAPVHRLDNFCAALVQQGDAGWLCVVNLCPRPERQCQALCRQYCEWLMRDCSVLGRGCSECYPVPLSVMRRRIAHAVAAKLC